MSHGMYSRGFINRLYQMDIFVTCNKLLDSYLLNAGRHFMFIPTCNNNLVNNEPNNHACM